MAPVARNWMASGVAAAAKLMYIVANLVPACFSDDNVTELIQVQLEQHHVDINLERNRSPNFTFVPLSTTISRGWDDLPLLPDYPNLENCEITFRADLTVFEFGIVHLCLFQNFLDESLFDPIAEVKIFDNVFKPSDFYRGTHPVIGYIRNNAQSRVYGYLIERCFYGSVRFFDEFRVHHVIFYIEPSENLKLYSKTAQMNDTEEKNAILFEYVPRLDTQDPPLGGGTKFNGSEVQSSGNSTGSVDGDNADQAHTREQPNVQQDNPDEDIIQAYKFKAGVTKHSIFDTRNLSTKICSLCIWIQPNFAQKFGLGSSIHGGVAEVVDLISFLNWIFRNMDFDMDGMAENIGFQIRSLIVNDNITITAAEKIESHQGPGLKKDGKEYLFATNMNTITPSHALKVATKQLAPLFSSCCATLAFIFHSMAPTLSATNLRGLCTSKNVAVITGLLRSTKLAKYDVSRSLLHTIGHLFGGHHDDITNLRCHENTIYRFLNPFVMDPIEQLNVGMRKNSFRMSACSNDHITQFLASNGVSCLTESKMTYCGNGLEEAGESCDCGSLWQCHLDEENCCGEGDTFVRCKILDPFKKRCRKTRVW